MAGPKIILLPCNDRADSMSMCEESCVPGYTAPEAIRAQGEYCPLPRLDSYTHGLVERTHHATYALIPEMELDAA